MLESVRHFHPYTIQQHDVMLSFQLDYIDLDWHGIEEVDQQ